MEMNLNYLLSIKTNLIDFVSILHGLKRNLTDLHAFKLALLNSILAYLLLNELAILLIQKASFILDINCLLTLFVYMLNFY